MVGIVNYGMGNLHSIQRKLHLLHAEYKIVNHPEEIDSCDRLILPGVGHFGMAMQRLEERNLLPALHAFAHDHEKPILGICLGMQIMCKSSSENGINNGLNIFKGKVTKLKKINVGWRSIVLKTIFLKKLRHLKNFFYYNHSYYYSSKDLSIIAKTNSLDIPAILKIKNNFGIQFHPEKSQDSGILLFKDILKC